ADQGRERALEEIRAEEQEGAVALPVRPAAVPAAGAGAAGADPHAGQAGGEGAGATAPAPRSPRAPAARGHDPRRRPGPRRRGDPVEAPPDAHVPQRPRLHAAAGEAFEERERLEAPR